LVVGDTPHDVDCAHTLGARVLAVTTGGSAREELAAHRPDWLVDDLTAIAAAMVADLNRPPEEGHESGPGD
jgi:phosphoglycolate phosphatase-like HAD superfamily hydrolase